LSRTTSVLLYSVRSWTQELHRYVALSRINIFRAKSKFQEELNNRSREVGLDYNYAFSLTSYGEGLHFHFCQKYISPPHHIFIYPIKIYLTRNLIFSKIYYYTNFQGPFLIDAKVAPIKDCYVGIYGTKLKRQIWVTSNGMTFILNFLKISQLI